jgi:hypothetical protein
VFCNILLWPRGCFSVPVCSTTVCASPLRVKFNMSWCYPRTGSTETCAGTRCTCILCCRLVLPLDMSVLVACAAPGHVCSSSLCCPWTCLFWKPVLPLDMSVLVACAVSGHVCSGIIACCPWTCQFKGDCAIPGRACSGCSTAAFAGPRCICCAVVLPPALPLDNGN